MSRSKNTKEVIKNIALQAESQEDTSVPADGHKAIINKANKSQRQTESGRTMTININDNRSTALELSLINYGVGGRGYARTNLA